VSLAGSGRAALLVALLLAPQERPLRITFFDVGQGDAALIVSPTGKKILVDAGPAPTRVAEELRRLQIDTLDLVVASHNHADHIGGMAAVIRSVVVRNYLENEMPQTTRTYADLVHALESRHVPVLRAVPRRIDLGGGASARVLVGLAGASSQNNRSIGLVVEYGRFSALFTGDAEGPERSYWADSASVTGLELLKIAHHGSINGTDSAFLAVVRPCVAVISAGNPNKFGHPSPVVTRLLQRDSIRAFRTDVDGAIMVSATTDGGMIISHRPQGRRSGTVVEHPGCAQFSKPNG
jgi:competence protein ComEC